MDDYSFEIKCEFGWNVSNDFSCEQLGAIYKAGCTILDYLEKHLPGQGKVWMQRNISRVHFFLGGLPQKFVTAANHGKPTSVTFLTNRIWLEPTFEQGGNPVQHVIHEVAHTIDNVVGSHHHALLPIWFGHGPSDQLAKYLGGSPKGLRWQNGLCGIRRSNQWVKTDPETQYGYGNHSTADYFAESLAWTIINPSKIVQPHLREWIRGFIESSLIAS